MYLEPNIEPTFWNFAVKDNWLATNVNNTLNAILKPFKLWTGRFGVFGLAFLGAILVIPLYFFVKFHNRRTIRSLRKVSAELIDSIRDEKGNLNNKKWREVSRRQLELSRIIKDYKSEKDQRQIASGIIMRKFLKQETLFLSSLETIDAEMRNELYPNINKTYTQEELKAMSSRSQYQEDLNDIELDASLEKYLM